MMTAIDKRAIITGITGYIGSNLVRTLIDSGWNVAGIIRQHSDTKIIDDIKDHLELCHYDGTVDSLTKFIGNFKPTIAFHLASCFVAEHQSNQVTDLIQSNVLFGAHLLEAMTCAGIAKLVNTSTSWQHYHSEIYNPVCLYAATKEAFEKIVDFYVSARNFKVITLEIFDTYGPNDPRKKLINLFMRIAASGEKLAMSPGEQELDLVYIDDVTAAFAKASELLFSINIANEKYMVTTGKPEKLKNIAKMFEQVFKVDLNIEWGGREYRKREVMKVWSNGAILPEWCATYTLCAGLEKIVDD